MNRRKFLASTGTLVTSTCVSRLLSTSTLSAAGTAETAVAASAPKIFWISDPVAPGEIILLMGDCLAPRAVVEMAHVRPHGSKEYAWRSVELLQSDEQMLKALVPSDWHTGMFVCRVRIGSAVSNMLVANAPTAWWWNGDSGEFATPGGWVRLFGKSLGKGSASRVRFSSKDRQTIELQAQGDDTYALHVSLPVHFAPGNYKLSVRNGFGGESTWQAAGTLLVQQEEQWKSDVFNIEDFGKGQSSALQAALDKAKANGGGIVYLPRGRYAVTSSITIPPRTVLKGEAMDLVSLYWPDYDIAPANLVNGSNYGLESLTIYCQNHRDVVTCAPDSRRFFMNKVRIRANCYFMLIEIDKEFHGRRGPKNNFECGTTVVLQGRNFSVTECDIYASNEAVRVKNGSFGVIARNRIRYGMRTHGIENADRLIFEDNKISGAHLLAMGNDISTFYSNYCQHIYYARNHISQVYGGDRELMTLDAAGAAYSGDIAKTNGLLLTLAADPVYRDYAKPSHIDWKGSIVQILDGKGAGQYRFVTANSGREWQIDRPWDVIPDATSRISITPFRGQNLFIGNQLEDGGAFQLYAAAHDSIVANNRGVRMDGFTVWGLNPHGWGVQPVWFCQFLDNEIVEGNGYGYRSARFGTLAYDESNTFDGPLVRAVIFRRNICRNNAYLIIDGATVDALVEHCDIRNTKTGIIVAPSTRGTLLRNNTFEHVEQKILHASDSSNKYPY